MTSPEHADEFYVTLPSNASAHVFPNNTTASYTTKLVQPLHLVGDWVVGLTGISIPWSFYNIVRKEEIIIHTAGKKKTEYNIKFSPGYYDSVDTLLQSIPQLVEAEQRKYALKEAKEKEEEKERLRLLLQDLLKVTLLNKQLEAELSANDPEAKLAGDDPIIPGLKDEDDATAVDDPHMLHYDHTRNHVFIKHRRYRRRQYVIEMTPGLQNLLGFSNDPNVENHSIHYFPHSQRRRPMIVNIAAPYPCNLDYNIPSEINVCLDVVKTQPHIGNLIRKISVHKYQYGQMQSFRFDRPHYVKVEKTYFHTLQVDLKDEHGKKLPFEFGTSSITLHFKHKP